MKQFVTREHDLEPVAGLPAKLPESERMLWQGRPSAKLVARHLLKSRWISAYFVALAGWAAISGYADGHSLGGIAFSVAVLTGLAALMIGLIELFAWAIERTTLYTVTTERVVMRFGVALSMTLNLPYKQVNSVALASAGGDAGSVAIALLPGHRMSWLIQWPHVRAWRFSTPEPTLICLPDATKVAKVLALAITQYSSVHSGHARLVEVVQTDHPVLTPHVDAAE